VHYVIDATRPAAEAVLVYFTASYWRQNIRQLVSSSVIQRGRYKAMKIVFLDNHAHFTSHAGTIAPT